jgi:hypothetical protein
MSAKEIVRFDELTAVYDIDPVAAADGNPGSQQPQ